MPRRLFLTSSILFFVVISWLLVSPVGHPAISTDEEYAWQKVDSPTTSDLWDVEMVSSNDGWVVGSNTFVHWDGNVWSQGSATATGFYQGVGMVSSSDGWAVGLDGKIARWDGTSWKDFITLPDEEWLWDVDMLSANDGWIVGDGGTICVGMAATGPSCQALLIFGFSRLEQSRPMRDG